MFGKKYDYTGREKQELKDLLKILDYEIASTKSKKELKELYRKIEAINKELIRQKKEEIESNGRRK